MYYGWIQFLHVPMRKTLKWAGVIVLTPVLLFITLAVLLYIPAVQNWAVKQVVAYASDKPAWTSQ